MLPSFLIYQKTKAEFNEVNMILLTGYAYC